MKELAMLKNAHTMELNPSNQNGYLKKLTYQERMQLLDKLKQMLYWMEEYGKKKPLARSKEERKLYKQKSTESTLLSNQLSQHALIARNQLGYLLIDTMEVMEIAMDIDPHDDEKYFAYRQLKKAYVKFMKAFHHDFRKN